MTDIITTFRVVENPFFMESVEGGTDTNKLEYHERGRSVYVDARQVLVRSCHDALISHHNEKGKKGIILVHRMAEPARGYLWPLGGFFDRGISSTKSLISRIKEESGLDVKEDSLVVLGHSRGMWKTTPNKNTEKKGLPLGIDDTILLYYGEGHGNLSLDGLHEKPLIVTPEMYTPEFRNSLHPYVQLGIDRAMRLI